MTISQIDRLGERLRTGSTAHEDLIALAEYRNEFQTPTAIVAEQVAEIVRPFDANVAQRPATSTPSIVAKLQRERSRLSAMQDVGGIRVVVAKTLDQDRVVGLIAERWAIHRVIDRRAEPKHGYRAVHVIVSESSRKIEVQIRTQLQNLWAQTSESLGDRFGQEVKYGGRAVTGSLVQFGETIRWLEVHDLQLDEMRRLTVLPLWRNRRNQVMFDVDRSA